NTIAPIADRNVKSIAHITLTDKLTDDPELAGTVANLIGIHEPFTVKLEGWDYFDHGHSITIYIKVVTPAPIITLAELLKSAAKTPHIGLAKKIDYDTFKKLKPYLDALCFEAEWQCFEITVLRKLMSEKHLGFKDSFRIPL